jgi:hypothetical protein
MASGVSQQKTRVVFLAMLNLKSTTTIQTFYSVLHNKGYIIYTC